MKKYFIKAASIAAMAMAFLVVAPAQAHADVRWNTNVNDCRTVVVGNNTTGENIQPVDYTNPCWHNATTVHAAPGDHINVQVYYHNTGSSPAPTTMIHMSAAPSGPVTSYTFSGSVSSSGATASGSGTVLLSSAQTLTFNQLQWTSDNGNGGIHGYPTPTDVFGPGVSIGTINPDCTPATGCHVGWVIASFIVGNAAPTPACTINSFTASPTSVAYNGSSTLSWNTSNCSSVSVTGPGVSNSQINGSTSTGALTNTSSYTISGNGPGGAASPRSVTVSVGAAAGCNIGSFTANPLSVNMNGFSTLTWNTTNCTGVTVSGPTGTLSTQPSGNVSTGSLTSTSTFTLRGSGTAGPVSQSVTVTVNAAAGCTINSFNASPSSVATGATATLVWSTTGCQSVSVYGTGVSANTLNGSILTPQLYATTTYTISAYGTTGIPVTQNTVVNVNAGHDCAISYFNANPLSVPSGSSSTIAWGTANCTSVTVSGMGVSSSSLTGSVSTGPLTQTATYTITAVGAAGIPVTQSLSVGVSGGGPACSIASFLANPSIVQSGSLSTLTWSTPNCTNVTLSGGTNWSNTPVYSNSLSTGALYNTTTYTLSAYGPGTSGMGTITSPIVQSVTVTVQNNQTTCTINSFYASPTQVISGGSSTLFWNTTGCSSVNVTGPGVTSYSFSDSRSVGPIYGTATYTITASSASGMPVTQSTTVTTNNINNNTPPQVTTNPATNIIGGSATLNGYISNGPCATPIYPVYGNPVPACVQPVGYAYSPMTYYFQYGTTQYALNQQTPMQTLNTSGNVSAYVSNLLPNTTYFFQLIGSNSYGQNSGAVLSFTTIGNNSNLAISAITSVATNVTASSARLNGLVTGPQSVPIQTYFEYGTSPALGTQTGLQTVSTYVVTNYFDTITTVPNTTYYYRIVATSNGQIYPGATVSFTSGTNIVINNNPPPTVITRVINTGTGGGSAYVMLSITDQSQTVLPGDSVNYTVTYQNISGVTLSNAVLDVILPTGVTFRNASQGVLTTNNTVAITLGTLLPNQPPATINIVAVANPNDVPGNNFVTTATLAFTTPSRAQDSAIAYVLNTVGSQNNLAGLALFGAGFFPNSLLGWIILIGLILILLFIARYFYHRANAEKVAMAGPVTHVHYDTPVPTPPMGHSNNGYQNGYQPNNYPGNNLPH